MATTSPPLLLYSDLFAVDADGRELPSRMRLVGQTVRLEVDAAGARYPVTVDPMWTQQSLLFSADGAGGDQFGFAVAVDGDTAVFGASRKKVGTNSNQGQAYVFVRSGTSWSQQAILVDSATGAASDYFGNSVALSGDTAVIGAPNKKVGVNARQGQAYVFVRSGTSFTPQALGDSLTGAAMDYFGSSVAVSGDTIVVGSAGKSVGARLQQGQGYVFGKAASPNGTPAPWAASVLALSASMLSAATWPAAAAGPLTASPASAPRPAVRMAPAAPSIQPSATLAAQPKKAVTSPSCATA